MSKSLLVEPRVRSKTLLIVEGNHEKNDLFRSLFKCFPEVWVDEHDVWIYGSNVYSLFDSLVNEYGNKWDELDVDLPLVISRTRADIPTRNKEGFKNIILVFDYERHDPKFSIEKIERMQAYFCDETDIGKLYINYPMIESYQHLQSILDPEFAALRVSTTLRPGAKYKALVRDSFFEYAIGLPEKIKEYLINKCGCEETNADSLIEQILNISRADNMLETISNILSERIPLTLIKSSTHYINHLIYELKYMKDGHNYWQYIRFCFQRAMQHNLRKCSVVLGGEYNLDDEMCRVFIKGVNYEGILSQQNCLSSDPIMGEIWVLNTCILLIPEYKYELMHLEA